MSCACQPVELGYILSQKKGLIYIFHLYSTKLFESWSKWPQPSPPNWGKEPLHHSIPSSPHLSPLHKDTHMHTHTHTHIIQALPCGPLKRCAPLSKCKPYKDTEEQKPPRSATFLPPSFLSSVPPRPRNARRTRFTVKNAKGPWFASVTITHGKVGSVTCGVKTYMLVSRSDCIHEKVSLFFHQVVGKQVDGDVIGSLSRGYAKSSVCLRRGGVKRTKKSESDIHCKD